MSETTQRNPSRFRASMASPLSSIGPNLSPLSTPATTSVYGIRPRTAEEEPRMPQLLEMRLQPPPPSARFSSLDKIIISSADRFPGHLADGGGPSSSLVSQFL